MMDSILVSLKERCLSVVVENFERYYQAFKLSPGTELERHFDFLARAFSETIFNRFNSSYRLEAKYFDFLINPYIRRLNLEGITEELVPSLVDQLQVIESKIVFLKTEFWSVSVDCYVQLVSSVPKVEVIELGGIFDPEVLEEIGKKCAFLRVLKILCRDVDDVGLMNIFKNTHNQYEEKVCLEQLEIPETISHDGVSFVLNHAPSLKHLDYPDTPKVLYNKHKSDLENNCIDELKKYSLTSLTFPFSQINMLDTLKICTAVCPDISSLNVYCLENDEQLILCSKFHHLKDLVIDVEGNPFSFEAITQFLKLRGRGLFSIYLGNVCVLTEALVEHCPKLRSLKLNSVQFKAWDKKKCLLSKGKLSCLKTLAITRSDLSDKETANSLKLILSNAKNLNSVNFSGATGLTEDLVHSLLQLGIFELQELNLSSADVTLSGVTELLSHGSLQKLCLANCPNLTPLDYINLLEWNNNNVEILTSDFESDSDVDSFEADDYDYYYDYDEYDVDDYDDYLEYMGYECYNEYDDFDDDDDPGNDSVYNYEFAR